MVFGHNVILYYIFFRENSFIPCFLRDASENANIHTFFDFVYTIVTVCNLCVHEKHSTSSIICFRVGYLILLVLTLYQF